MRLLQIGVFEVNALTNQHLNQALALLKEIDNTHTHTHTHQDLYYSGVMCVCVLDYWSFLVESISFTQHSISSAQDSFSMVFKLLYFHFLRSFCLINK